MKQFLILIFIFALYVLSSMFNGNVHASDRLFEVQSVDTMKYSRDAARNPDVTDQIPLLVDKVAEIHPSHIAISTPYDEEFYPVLATWVGEARKHGLNVWFRGNFSAWEGWFGYDRFKDPNEHNDKTYVFITKHPELFKEGDIFTPAPEPENGGFGDPRQGEEIKKKFFEFLPASYANCMNAFAAISRTVSCGYFSTNGDVAKMIPKYVLEQSGGVQVIDHYVKTPEELIRDIEELYAQNHLPIVLGEYGAPIPDIHGDLSDWEQDRLIRANLKELAKHRDIVKGINYWTAFGGSTKIFDDKFKPKSAVNTLREYFDPIKTTGQVVDEWDNPISGAMVGIQDIDMVVSDTQGIYSFVSTKDFNNATVVKEGYFSSQFRTPSRDKQNIHSLKIRLTKKNRTWMERFQIILYQLGFYKRGES